MQPVIICSKDNNHQVNEMNLACFFLLKKEKKGNICLIQKNIKKNAFLL